VAVRVNSGIGGEFRDGFANRKRGPVDIDREWVGLRENAAFDHDNKMLDFTEGTLTNARPWSATSQIGRILVPVAS
jgi:hypothetical protein